MTTFSIHFSLQLTKKSLMPLVHCSFHLASAVRRSKNWIKILKAFFQIIISILKQIISFFAENCISVEK